MPSAFVLAPMISGLTLFWQAQTVQQFSSCIELNSASITVGDLAQRLPEFRTLPGDLRYGFAPDVGMRRVISAGELNRFLVAARHRSSGESSGTVTSGICFTRGSRRVTPDEVRAAIEVNFKGRDVQVEVLEVSKREVATQGLLQFSIRELPTIGDPKCAITWNGWYVESDGRKRPLWARLRLKESVMQAVAQRDLAVGEVLTEENVRLERRERFPALEVEVPEVVWGHTPRSPILAGTPIDPKRLAKVPAMRKGESIVLEAVTPLTRLTIKATAESTAYVGQRVWVTSSLSKKAVQATAAGNGRAVVSASSGVEVGPTRNLGVK